MWKVFFVTLLSVNTAWACFAPPESAMVSVEDMVKMNDNIYLAEAVSFSKPGASLKQPSNMFRFKVIETLKGKSVSTLKLEGFRSKDGRELSDFDGHKDKDFWSNNTSGRLINDPSCQVQASFAKGTRYLIFPKQPYAYKSLEIVKTDEDLLLKKVRELIASANKK